MSLCRLLRQSKEPRHALPGAKWSVYVCFPCGTQCAWYGTHNGRARLFLPKPLFRSNTCCAQQPLCDEAMCPTFWCVDEHYHSDCHMQNSITFKTWNGLARFARHINLAVSYKKCGRCTQPRPSANLVSTLSVARLKSRTSKPVLSVYSPASRKERHWHQEFLAPQQKPAMLFAK